jgi:pantoate--beta-alanine ligase
LTTPVLASTRAELAAFLEPARRAGRPVGFVPTMGALHEGHASLMRVARTHVGDGPVVVSIFVNPMQFGSGEDLDRYPRTLDADLVICGGEGVDVVFAPSVEEMYPHGAPASDQEPDGVTVVPAPGLADILEGTVRPGHFRGVLTVVAKLFGLVRPDVAVFGEKDFQQLALIRRMAEDLCLGVDVVGAETQRDADGLALSSRNRYLSAEERVTALSLSAALRAANAAAADGVQPALDAAHAVLAKESGVDLDYLVITRPDLGRLADDAHGEARILVAARVGKTRLIDNAPIHIGASTTTGGDSTTEGDT